MNPLNLSSIPVSIDIEAERNAEATVTMLHENATKQLKIVLAAEKIAKKDVSAYNPYGLYHGLYPGKVLQKATNLASDAREAAEEILTIAQQAIEVANGIKSPKVHQQIDEIIKIVPASLIATRSIELSAKKFEPVITALYCDETLTFFKVIIQQEIAIKKNLHTIQRALAKTPDLLKHIQASNAIVVKESTIAKRLAEPETIQQAEEAAKKATKAKDETIDLAFKLISILGVLQNSPNEEIQAELKKVNKVLAEVIKLANDAKKVSEEANEVVTKVKKAALQAQVEWETQMKKREVSMGVTSHFNTILDPLPSVQPARWRGPGVLKKAVHVDKVDKRLVRMDRSIGNPTACPMDDQFKEDDFL